jgi:membrane protease YdiL (CAAX protease family)
MKAFFKSNPSWSFILLTFTITFFFWFLPAVIALPKDIVLGAVLLGGCGPLIAGYVLTVVNSEASYKIGSKAIFFSVFIGALIVLAMRLLLTDRGLGDINGKIPTLGETGVLGYILFAVVFFILALNASNATTAGLKENYLGSFIFKRSAIKWYLIAVLIFPVLAIVSYFAGKGLNLETSDFVVNTGGVWLVGFFSTFFFFGGNEEFGWRGFLQKELQKKYNPLITSLVISFLWSLWHLPLHYNGFYSTGGITDLLPRFIWTIPLTIIFTWFYNRSTYSILALVLLHAMFNNFSKGFGTSEIVFPILAILFSVYCLVDDRMWKKKAYHEVYEGEGL